VKDALVKRGNIVVTHIEASSLTLLEKPEFAFAKSGVPAHLKKMHADLSCADAFVVITPEYNHAPCPGVVNILNHFGSSVFGFKPSAIVSYSAGQWGGTRAAHGLRPILSELGCLPVSAMIHIPHAGQVFDENGDVLDITEQEKWDRYAQRCFSQLEWWGEATKQHKQIVDPTVESPAFQSTPSERNSPAS
jgi:chromate reductase